MGDRLTMADCAAAPPLFYARQAFPFDDRPHVVAYWKRLAARPAYASVIEEATPWVEKLQAARGAA